MSRILPVIASAALFVGACSSHEARLPHASIETSTTISPDEEALKASRIEAYRKLFQTNADIQIIHVPTPQSDPLILDSYESKDLERLKSHDPDYLERIRQGVEGRTDDRYAPAHVTVVDTETFQTKTGCLDTEDQSLTTLKRIWSHAMPFEDPSKLNVIFVDQPSCNSEVLGLAVPGDTPILSANAISAQGFVTQGIEQSIVHELSHSAGLKHANLLDCQDSVRITGCGEEKKAADPNSLMGYLGTFDSTDFTMPELQALSLLHPSEVLANPANGNYQLPNKLLSVGKYDTTSPKLITLDTDKGTVYISLEEDMGAKSDKKCMSEAEIAQQKIDPAAVKERSKTINGVETKYGCIDVNYRAGVSLQTRIESPKGFDLVTRPDRAPDEFGEERASGEVIPGTVVYQDNSVKVTLVSIDEKTWNTTVRVERSA